jgi:superfamily II DNA or RNA helicase
MVQAISRKIVEKIENMMEFTITNKIQVRGAPGKFETAVKERLTFPNPKWLENDKRGYWNGDTPRHLKYYEQADNGLIIPRGFIRHLIGVAKAQGIRYHLEDRRRTLREVDFTFHGKLKPFQKAAVQNVLQHDFGVLSSATGSGKTCMALYAIAKRKQPVLVVVHTKELLNQWINMIETFLKTPAKDIGIIGDGKVSLGDRITVATVQTLYKCADEVKDHIGFLIVDECHKAPARTFSEAVTAFGSKFMLGLSATPWRRDKLSRLIYWSLGDIVHEVSKESLLKTKDILPVEVITRQTEFRTLLDPSEQYSKMLSELTQDTMRNELIASDVAGEAKKGKGVCLVLSDRKAHCEAIQSLLWREYKIGAELLTGDIPKTKREAIVDKLNSGKIRVLIATGQLIGEGFDCKQLSTLFLATPIRFDGRVIQYLGRVLRPASGKRRAVVYDYIDSHVGPLKASAKSRMRVYQRAA